ncbi:kyphoscoliosis peptidase [Elysia marginata]|uniref:Kyphoscoliosis peptidase n=1 Tax=Elysia marginata TaxID=1093978 RepID=A0AAV4INK3_9GAST|nr:kyphoscoliosis peptidase [Elysia marginata]
MTMTLMCVPVIAESENIIQKHLEITGSPAAVNLINTWGLDRSAEMRRRWHSLLTKQLAKKREELFESQKRLEEQLRKEEDAMFNQFREERGKEDVSINKEIDTEWESKLRELTDRYEKDMDKKKKKMKDSDKKLMTIQFENEKKDLEATMRSKKEYKKKTMTLRLRQKEQQQTADLVRKQSHLMLEMLAKEQQELKAELAKEINLVGT